MTITDLTEKEVFSAKDFVGPNLDVSALIHGIYTICIIENKRTLCKKLMMYYNF